MYYIRPIVGVLFSLRFFSSWMYFCCYMMICVCIFCTAVFTLLASRVLDFQIRPVVVDYFRMRLCNLLLYLCYGVRHLLLYIQYVSLALALSSSLTLSLTAAPSTTPSKPTTRWWAHGCIIRRLSFLAGGPPPLTFAEETWLQERSWSPYPAAAFCAPDVHFCILPKDGFYSIFSRWQK